MSETERLFVHARNLRRALRHVRHAAETSFDRPVLRCICLANRDGGLWAVASDNYRLAFALVPSVGNPAVVGDRSTVLDSDAIGTLLGFLKGRDEQVELSVDKRTLRVGGVDSASIVPLFDEAFPDVDAITRRLPVAAFVSHNPYRVAGAIRAARRHADATLIRLAQSGPSDPIVIEADGYREIVMPVRTSPTTDASSFADRPAVRPPSESAGGPRDIEPQPGRLAGSGGAPTPGRSALPGGEAGRGQPIAPALD